jgi:hypothetical protein
MLLQQAHLTSLQISTIDCNRRLLLTQPWHEQAWTARIFVQLGHNQTGACWLSCSRCHVTAKSAKLAADAQRMQLRKRTGSNFGSSLESSFRVHACLRGPSLGNTSVQQQPTVGRPHLDGPTDTHTQALHSAEMGVSSSVSRLIGK